ncbi:hypothetical protein B0H14DRAFT_2812891 [Mycena olivaceomarginata]|nr:hypothetical protein B0H14DRAFT_2812891 [Mycena olivaceomarginata]
MNITKKPALLNIVVGMYAFFWCLSIMLAIICAILAARFSIFLFPSLTVAMILNELLFTIAMLFVPTLVPYTLVISRDTTLSSMRLISASHASFSIGMAAFLLWGLFSSDETSFGVERSITVPVMVVYLWGALGLNWYCQVEATKRERPKISRPMIQPPQGMRPVLINDAHNRSAIRRSLGNGCPVPF